MFDQEGEDALARGEEKGAKAKCPECRGDMDSKRLVSLESFKAAHCPEENEDDDSYMGSASEADEDDEWLFAEERKRKGKGREYTEKKSRKRAKPVVEEEDWITSAKIEKLCEILEGIRTNDPHEKIIIFSQVHHPLRVSNIVHGIP